MIKEEMSELLALIADAKEVNEGMRAVLKLIAEIETTTEWRLVRNQAVGWIFRSLPDILPGVPPEDDGTGRSGSSDGQFRSFSLKRKRAAARIRAGPIAPN